MLDDKEKLEDENLDLDESDDSEDSGNNETEKSPIDPLSPDEQDFDFKFISQQNKHKLDGKHSLERDILFTGKLEEKDENDPDYQSYQVFYNEEVSIETGSQYEYESMNNEDYVNDLHLEKDIFDLLSENTNLDFTQNRRKPKREDFNGYYNMLLKHLSGKYTNCEIFVALSYYFTDNIFNMYKLLNKKHATNIIVELKNKGYLDNLGSINFV
jgi:hypothetical protein